MNKRGTLFIVSGPSGVGKDTVLKELMPQISDKVVMSVSNTTRAPRAGEVDGVDYNFIPLETFRELIKDDMMLEYADFCSVCYGTPLEPVERTLSSGKSMILKIEREGMLSVKKKYPEAVTVFIAPPDEAELERRIVSRKTDSEENIRKRLERAKYEIANSGDYDYHVINGNLQDAVNQLKTIILSNIDN